MKTLSPNSLLGSTETEGHSIPRFPPWIWRAGLAFSCFAALLTLIAAPWAAHRGSWIAPVLYALFDPLCHQLPDRSFHLLDHPLAVCHRCSGLYLGFALGIALWPALPAAAARLLERPRSIVVFLAPLAIDAVLLANTPATRFSTGLLAAFPVALLVLAAAARLAAPHAVAEPLEPSGASARGAA